MHGQTATSLNIGDCCFFLLVKCVYHTFPVWDQIDAKKKGICRRCETNLIFENSRIGYCWFRNPPVHLIYSRNPSENILDFLSNTYQLLLFCWICLWINSIPEKLLWVLIVQTWQPSLGPILPIFTGLSQQLCQCLARRAPIVQTVERFAGESIRLAVFVNNEVFLDRAGEFRNVEDLVEEIPKEGATSHFVFLGICTKGASTFPLVPPPLPQAYPSYWGSLTDEHWSPLSALFKTNGWQAWPPWDVVSKLLHELGLSKVENFRVKILWLPSLPILKCFVNGFLTVTIFWLNIK